MKRKRNRLKLPEIKWFIRDIVLITEIASCNITQNQMECTVMLNWHCIEKISDVQPYFFLRIRSTPAPSILHSSWCTNVSVWLRFIYYSFYVSPSLFPACNHMYIWYTASFLTVYKFVQIPCYMYLLLLFAKSYYMVISAQQTLHTKSSPKGVNTQISAQRTTKSKLTPKEPLHAC